MPPQSKQCLPLLMTSKMCGNVVSPELLLLGGILLMTVVHRARHVSYMYSDCSVVQLGRVLLDCAVTQVVGDD